MTQILEAKWGEVVLYMEEKIPDNLIYGLNNNINIKDLKK